MGRRKKEEKSVSALWPDRILGWKHGNTLYGFFVLILYLITLSALLFGDIGRVRWGFIAVCIAVLPALAEMVTPIIFPWLMKWLTTLPLIMHMAGGLYGFYFTGYPVYDKIAHLAASIALAFLVFEMILVIAYVTDTRPSRFTVIALIFGLVIFFSLAWEYAEYNLDVVSGSTFFLSIEDSVADMVFNTIGICFVLYWVSRYMKREPFDKILARFVRTKSDPVTSL